MKTHLWIGTLLGISLFSAGCFDVKEELWLKRDGSGTMQVSLNLGKAIRTLSYLDDEVDKKGYEAWADSLMRTKFALRNFDSLAEVLEQQPGITQAAYRLEKRSHVMRFSFEHVAALNQAFAFLQSTNRMIKEAEFSWEGKTFSRMPKATPEKKTEPEPKQKGGLDGALLTGLMRRQVGSGAYSMYIYLEKKPKDLRPSALRKIDKKSVFLTYKMSRVMKEDQLLTYSFTYPKK
ncbi:MAG: hypothetical protein AAFR61_19880 [Bacteroidota bacterium]